MKLYIPLTKEEADRLEQQAKANRRTMRDEATYLVVRQLEAAHASAREKVPA